MSLRRAAPLFAFCLALTAAGCKTADMTPLTCDPACADGYRCDDTSGTCVPAALDAAVPDLAPAPLCTPACAAPTPFCSAQHQCVACLKDADCPVGNVCKTGALGAQCVPGCTDDSRCPNGQKCCESACVDPKSDANNCGGCGMKCSGAHASASCSGGACQLGGCDTGWGDCNNDPKDGCESNLHTDPANCTACGMACGIANAVNGCSDGCYVKSCKFGWADCNNDPKDGCETSVASDAKNCGACGQTCSAPPHAQAACQTALCVVTSCQQGWSDCDQNGANGCETQTGIDVKNCGACGNACGQGLVCINGACTCQQCNIPNSKTRCVNNQCVWDSCLPGYADCNNNTADGCEINLNTDPKNCGSCGNVCPMNTPSCGNGLCVVGLDFGPMHTFNGMTSTHYITQGCCSVNCNATPDQNAAYFCTHFYGQRLNMNCTPKPGYMVAQTPNCTDPKMHKNGGCTSQGLDIANTTCDPNGGDSACKIGNWNECTTGLTNLICHCQ